MAEFAELVKGAQEREERLRELVAWGVMHVMNASGNMKQPVTMDKLLGPAYTVRQLKREPRGD